LAFFARQSGVDEQALLERLSAAAGARVARRIQSGAPPRRSL
jgi:hypothetical protein